MTNAANHPWTEDVQRLRRWFVAYLILWGLGLAAAATSSATSSTDSDAGFYVLLLCIVPYVVCIVYAYRIQKQLNSAGLYRHGAWQVVVGAFFLNPFILGFLIPASVLWANRRINRRLLATRR
jgi:RsiW-degrading membrane proteinase PrsW (M82 family)